MTPEQIVLVQESWAKVVPISEKAAELFYAKLFELDPEVKALFKSDMKEQGKKLMGILNTAVNALNDLESIVPAVQDMGRRHVGYGVKDEDYDTVGEALIWTLGQGLGDDFTDEVKDAWIATYTLVANTMKDAASEVKVA
jgi:hemoglobin-like flavoprotein